MFNGSESRIGSPTVKFLGGGVVVVAARVDVGIRGK